MNDLNAKTQSVELILVRHAASTRAEDGVWGRLYDAPLAEGFEFQLAETKSYLQAAENLRIVSSPLRRCRETAAFVFPQGNVEIVDEFRAYHSGALEDATEQLIQKQYPEYFKLSYRERFLQPKFNEESIEEQAHRVARGLLKMLDDGGDGSGRRTAIFTHFSVLNIIAHIVSQNWNLKTYADGTFNVDLGSFMLIPIDAMAVTRDVRDHFRLQY